MNVNVRLLHFVGGRVGVLFEHVQADDEAMRVRGYHLRPHQHDISEVDRCQETDVVHRRQLIN